MRMMSVKMSDQISKEQLEYAKQRQEWFVKNNKVSMVERYSFAEDKESKEYFIGDWTAIDTIRDRMKKIGKSERCCDVHSERLVGFINGEYGENHEVVDYLYFVRTDETKDYHDDDYEYDEERYYFSIVDKP